MDYENMRVVELKALVRERGVRGYSQLRKADLIASLRESGTRQPREQPIPAPMPSVRFRPDRPRQPELMRRLEGIPPRPLGSSPRRTAPRPAPNRGTEFKPYQLKPKRGKIEPPVTRPRIQRSLNI